MHCQIIMRLLPALFGSVALLAGQPAGQEIPQRLQPPAGEHLFLTVHAKGDQVYTCKEGVTRNGWNLTGPDAQLFYTDGKPFGKHSAGPIWQASDGSRVTGKAVTDSPSPDPNSIPWLLLQVVSHEGSGVLSRATSVQRVNTKGGKAPDSCDQKDAGKELRVPYTADYLFYAPK
jgi:Protein of unknown function (DUF3455)